MWRLEARQQRSRVMLWTAPFIAVVLTLLSGMLLFIAIGVDPYKALGHIILDPFSSAYSRSELFVKAAPLALIAIGLSLGFRAGVWNIGAEGQFVLGAICGGWVALAFYQKEAIWLFPLICVAGAIGGAAWAAIPAFLRVRFKANEILVSLMLVYISVLLLSALVTGPMRNPDGMNFPESRVFHQSALAPILLEGTRAHVGLLFPVIAAFALWIILSRHEFGFAVRLFGDAPRAARFAGFSENSVIWTCMLISGALAGLAGALQASGPIGQLVPDLPAGYGFTAIIIAFLGRLHPFGVLAASLALAVTYIGGQSAQVAMSLPAAVTGVFQGFLLFFLLGIDVLVNYRVRRVMPTQLTNLEGR